MAQPQEKIAGREAQRLETRQRVFESAIREFGRTGMADADVGAIVTAAGVARGTFYFHFPTKEHVLAELTRREEDLIGEELAQAFARDCELPAILAEVIRRVVAEEARLGTVLFRDVLSFYFSPNFPEVNDSAKHPVAVTVIEQIERAKERGEVYPDTDAPSSGTFFLLGLYAVLVTNRDPAPARTALLDKYLHGFLRGLQTR